MKKPSFAALFAVILITMSILSLAMPKQLISTRENRSLHPYPVPSFQQIKNGSYQAELETAFQDQVFLRDGFMHIQRSFQQMMGMRRIQDVYIGDQQLFQVPSGVDHLSYEALADAMNAFANQYPDKRYDLLLVPTANAILSEKFFMPDLLGTQQTDIPWFTSMLQEPYHTTDTISVLQEHVNEPLYYRGDHHWTTLGAYTIFQQWQKERGIDDDIIYETKVINDAFYGTLSNASGIDIEDQITLYIPEEEPSLIVTYVQEQTKRTSLYEAEKQYFANPYEVFLGGNFDRIDITTTAPYERTLLLVKDSYANCFIPFLVPYYHKIIVIDPRYHYEPLSDIMDSEAITDVMFLYNAQTFFSDASLKDLMQEEE